MRITRRSVPDLHDRIRGVLRETPPVDVPAWRLLRKGWSRELASASPAEVLALALDLIDVGPLATPRGLAFHIAGHELHHHRVLSERYLPLAQALPWWREG